MAKDDPSRSRPVPEPARAYKTQAIYQGCWRSISGCGVPLQLCIVFISLIYFIYLSLPRLGWDFNRDSSFQLLHSLPHGKSNSSMNSSLVPFTFQPLPLGSVKPRGWLRDQMVLMAAGMAGHEYDFYPIVRSSPWLGGHSEYSELNEGFPYWFNGIVPLAYGLDDPRLKAQIRNATDYVLAYQQASGWLGPESQYNSRHVWAHFPFFLGLMQLVQADSGYTAQVIPAMHKFVRLLNVLLLDGESDDEVWGRVRYADMIICLQWLYETHPEGNEQILLETMQRLKAHGVDWAGYYTKQNYIFEDLDNVPNTNAIFPFVHAVNVGQGLKTGAVNYRFTHNQTLLESCRNGVNWTFDYHGAASGTILGDEREAGLSPTRGSELCTAVETMYSMSYLYHMLGDNIFADLCELAAFNALPTMMSPDHWAHQYIAQPNQPWSRKVKSAGLFWNVGDYGTTFGLSPHYPCCTVNHPQGFPKFLSASFVLIGPNGLGHALLGPAAVSAALPSGTLVTVDCETDYPFSHFLKYRIQATAPFVFHIRLPHWAQSSDATLHIDDQPVLLPTSDPHTGMFRLPLSPQTSTSTSTITINLHPTLRIVPRANDSIAIYHGQLLYALDVGEDIQVLPPSMTISNASNFQNHSRPHPPPPLRTLLPLNPDPVPPTPQQAHDYRINPTLPWAIAIDPDTIIFHACNSSSPHNSSFPQYPYYNSTTCPVEPLPNPIFAHRAPPPYLTALGCDIAWPIEHGVPAPVPLKGKRACPGKAREVVLRPYGSLSVRMGELPVVDLGNVGGGG